MATMPTKPKTLDEAIEQAITLGQKDPIEIVKRLRESFGDEWFAEQVSGYADDFVAEMCRQRLNAQRRGAIAVLSSRAIRDKASSEVMIQSVWIPSQDGYPLYKRVADVTAAEWRSRADYLDRLAIGVLKQSRWARDVADLIDGEGVTTTGDLRVALPQLPANEDIDLPALEATS
jgi:hypothetical protein